MLKRTIHELPVQPPFRLALTATALRRVPTNVVDIITPDGEYVHAFAGKYGPLVARVSEQGERTLRVELEGDSREGDSREHVLSLIKRTLGADRDVSAFGKAAEQLPWLAPLAKRLVGIKPPRYRSLWEAFVNAVVFQQVSLHSATATVKRMVMLLGEPVVSGNTALYRFPEADELLSSSDTTLRATGLSLAKIATLRRAAEAINAGALPEGKFEEMPSDDIAEELRKIKGVGPWTASVILLRGFGRLDAFPMNDSGVARNLTLVARGASFDVHHVLSILGDQRGMLYFHLLLARLEERNEIGCASIPPV